ncbi:Diguanylate cyclase, GGDEF domain [Marinobacter sp. DSM 26671]|nr:Diguanylate cyclase, GGDEF domain [Marinobacter sp. DSM 26671]
MPSEHSPDSKVLSCSIGICQGLANEFDSIDDMIRRADEALYCAKKTGPRQPRSGLILGHVFEQTAQPRLGTELAAQSQSLPETDLISGQYRLPDCLLQIGEPS